MHRVGQLVKLQAGKVQSSMSGWSARANFFKCISTRAHVRLLLVSVGTCTLTVGYSQEPHSIWGCISRKAHLVHVMVASIRVPAGHTCRLSHCSVTASERECQGSQAVQCEHELVSVERVGGGKHEHS